MDSPKAHSSSRLKILLLGGFSVYVDGQILPDSAIKGRKARSLLKLLAHQRQYQIGKEQVLDILWPDLKTEAANAQLYKALYHTRKALGKYHQGAEDWIVITDDLIRLSPPGGLVTDVAIFEKAARAGLKDKNVAELEHAYGIYTGEFLPMDRYVEWASFHREHYRQLYLDVLSALAAAYEQQGKLSEAAEMMRLALDKEPTLETAHRGLMGIFAKKGQATRAFHQYEICRKILRDELGLSPSAETKKTLADVQDGKLLSREDKPTYRASYSAPPTTIIGCTKECTRIDQLLTGLNRQKGAGLVITGEAGLGKTRLVQELVEKTRRKGFSFFLGLTRPGMGSVAYGPFIELFIDIVNKQPEMANILPPELRRLVPGLAGEDHPLPHTDKLAAKGYLFAQVYRFFSKLTSNGPAVIILEDLHAADQGSKELLSYLIQHLGRLPILFVTTFRKEEGEPLPAFVLALKDHLVEVLKLAPLTYEDHVNLIQLHAGNAIIEAETAGHIYQLAEGNPFFAIELLRHFMENSTSSLSKQAEASGLIPYSPASKSLPDSVFQMVEQKLAKLSPAAHHLLYIAAVIGRQVPYELLALIWNSGNMEVDNGLFNALEEVIRSRFLEEHGLDYRFRHAIVQETIYSSVSEARRQIIHKQLADRLIALSADTPEVPVELIAWHYLGARDRLEAANYLLQAGQRAEHVYAHEDALQRYREACDVLEKGEGQKVINLKSEILERTGDIYRIWGQLEKSYEAYAEAISLAENMPLDNPQLMELHRKMAVSAICRSEIKLTEKHLEKAFELAGEENRSRARLYITKALHLWHMNRLEGAYELAKKALCQAKNADARAEVSQACETLAMICLPLGRWEEGLKLEQELQGHGWSPETVMVADVHHCLGEYHVSGDHPIHKARSFIEKVSHQTIQLGDLRGVAGRQNAMDTLHLRRDNRTNPAEKLSSNLRPQVHKSSPAAMAYSLARKSVLHTLLGAKEPGWQDVEEGFVYARKAAGGDHCLQRLYGVGIWNRLESGDLEQAGKLITKSEKLIARSDDCAACTLELYPWYSYYFLQTQQPDKARACCKAVDKLAKKTGNPIARAIAFMIKSSLCLMETDRKQAAEYSSKSHRILEEEIPQTVHAPIAHFISRMLEQQAVLAQR